MIDGLDSSWAQPRAADLLSRALGDSTDADGFMFQSSTSSAINNEMRFAAERSLRTSFIALASVNVVAAAATAVGIFFDCYLQARRKDPGFSLKSSLLTIIGPKETFPYILSLGIAIQGIIFAAAQSLGLGAILTLGCTETSQMMLPALFIVPYIQLVFGLETAIRALARQPFPRSPRWTLPVCLVVVLVALIATYAVTRAAVPPNFCFAELLWLVQRWALGSFAFLTLLAGIMLIGSLIICIRLFKSSGISEAQRTTASWTTCYMLLALVTTVMMVPFFWSLYADDTGRITRHQTRLSMAATIVVNLSGLLTGGLYVLLRFTKLGKLGRGGYLEFDRQKPAMGERSSTPGSSIYTKQLEQPVSPVRLEQMRRDLETGDGARSEKMSAWPTAFAAQAARPQTPGVTMPIPQIMSPEMAFMAGTLPGQNPGLRQDSYNLFPSRQGAPDTKSSYLLPAVAHNPDALSADELLPPAAAWTARHERKSSLASSATVQIALRVSNINDMPPVTSSYQEPLDSDGRNYRGDLGLAISTDPFADDASQYSASMYVDDDLFDFGEALAQQPPLPTATDKTTSDDEITLSPTVYDPDQPATKPRKAASGQWF
ncbi:hypothetical protein HRG_003020 [Hirsutella rhossiliensis]|uniref:Uncharacterized protein n=1 Tax=Hirsutella rhossiliensis TaxID=111463 RepID=A0A9P8N1A0_9HYPO|nr:uncharacterized protein HRG_03020 [Hirsutella rhossiliensis]KAH0965004.1 hypothetical protein HRG_03020 [Hirsutella rhossiliensis]